MVFNKLCLVFAAGLIALLPASDGLGQVIDDFEQGPFNLQNAIFDSSVQSGLTPPHCIASSRDVRLYVNGTISGADLSIGAVDDEVTTVFGNNGGRLEFRYAPLPTDLTAGGIFNALRVSVTVAEPAGRIEILLGDATGLEFLSSQFITGPGNYSFPYSDFSGVDLGLVDFVQVNLDVPDFGDYHISDIRPWEDPAAAAVADVLVSEIVAAPGDYPTEPLRIQLSSESEPDRHLGVMEVSVLGVTNDLPHGIVGQAEDSGGFMTGGEQAQLVLMDPAIVNLQKEGTHFRTIHMRVEFKPAEFRPRLQHVGRVDPFGNELIGCIDHLIKVYYEDAAGNVVARGVHTLLVEGALANGLEVRNPVFTMPTETDPNAFEVMFDVNVIGPLKRRAGLVMVEMQLNGSIFDYEASTPVNAWTPGQSLALWAQPSVMSNETVFRLSRGLTARAQLQVFDVAGRRVRTLALPAGRTALSWDGRDERGLAVASGVYLARVTGSHVEAKAKIVKVQ